MDPRLPDIATPNGQEPPPAPPLPVEEGPQPQTRPKRGGVNDSASVDSQPAAKRSSTAIQRTPGEYLAKILEIVQEGLGQTTLGLANLFTRNEQPLGTTVEYLRRALRTHHGHMELVLETFLTALGPGAPGVPVPPAILSTQTPSQTVVLVPPTIPPTEEITDRSAKHVMACLGQVLELYSVVAKKFGSLGNVRSAYDINEGKIAYDICQVMESIGEMLQYTYRSKLHNIENNLNQQLPNWKSRIENTIAKVEEANMIKRALAEEDSNCKGPPPILQTMPPLIFSKMEMPQIRIHVPIQNDELNSNPPEILQGPVKNYQPCVTKCEDNMLVSYGAVELINGTRNTTVSYNVEDVKFQTSEWYSSKGWIDPSQPTPEGQYIRALEFDLNGFKPGSGGHRIEVCKSGSAGASSGSEHVEISVTGIFMEQLKLTRSPSANQRAKFSFSLSPNLTMKHVNDAGVREGVLKVQFAK